MDMKKSLIIFSILIATLEVLIYIKGVWILKIISDSMEPEIKTGYFVVLVKDNRIKVGDVIAYKTGQNDIPITHRVSKIYKYNEAYYFITKGDNNSSADPYPISKSEILGKMLIVIPAPDFANNKFSFFLVLTLFLTPSFYFLGKTTAKMRSN